MFRYTQAGKSMRVYVFGFVSIFIFFQSVFPQTNPPNPGVSRVSALQSYRMGRDLEGRNRMDEAMRYYNQAVQTCLDEISWNTATGDTYAVFTWTLQRQKQYADVITWGERALQLYPNDYRIIETMGEAYFYLNQYDRSLRFMQRYVNFLPQGDRTSVAYFFIGEIFRLQGKFLHADIAYTTYQTPNPIGEPLKRKFLRFFLILGAPWLKQGAHLGKGPSPAYLLDRPKPARASW